MLHVLYVHLWSIPRKQAVEALFGLGYNYSPFEMCNRTGQVQLIKTSRLIVEGAGHWHRHRQIKYMVLEAKGSPLYRTNVSGLCLVPVAMHNVHANIPFKSVDGEKDPSPHL